MSGISRLLTILASLVATRTTICFTWSGSNRCFFSRISSASSGAWIGAPTVHFLTLVRVISYRSPSLSTSIDGSFLGANAWKKLSAPDRTSSTPVPPASTSSAAVTPFLAGMPPKSNAFSTCSVSRCHEARPEASCAV